MGSSSLPAKSKNNMSLFFPLRLTSSSLTEDAADLYCRVALLMSLKKTISIHTFSRHISEWPQLCPFFHEGNQLHEKQALLLSYSANDNAAVFHVMKSSETR